MTTHLAVAPYVTADSDGSDPRIAIPITTPGAFVMVESRVRGLFTVKNADRSGVRVAIEAAKLYASRHRADFDRLYQQIGRPKTAS
jgi:hypothetical protein